MHKKVAFGVIGALALIGCASLLPDWEPKTRFGAERKLKCSTNMQACEASSYTCDRAYRKCVSACKTIDSIDCNPQG